MPNDTNEGLDRSRFVHLTGDGLCAEIEPAIFEMHDDGLAYVKEVDWPSINNDGSGAQKDPLYQMSSGLAVVPEPNLAATIESAEECPGECIFLEVVED